MPSIALGAGKDNEKEGVIPLLSGGGRLANECFLYSVINATNEPEAIYHLLDPEE